MELEQAVSTLGTLGIGHVVLDSGSDGALLVVPEWGRVLGLWPHRRSQCSLWLDGGFLAGLQGGARLEEWRDPGGDRLWLWPDRDFIDRRTGSPSSAIEPGAYAATVDRSGCCLETRGDVFANASGARMGFRIERRVRPLGTEELAARWPSVPLRCSGYEENDTLEVGAGAPLVGLQGISRVRAAGEAWIALHPGARGACSVVHLGMGRRSVALSAAEARPLLLHLQRLEGGRSLLLVRECTWDWETGCGIGCFAGEDAVAADLVMRSPGIGGATGERQLRWTQRLAAFVGRDQEARSLARRLAAGPDG